MEGLGNKNKGGFIMDWENANTAEDQSNNIPMTMSTDDLIFEIGKLTVLNENSKRVVSSLREMNRRYETELAKAVSSNSELKVKLDELNQALTKLSVTNIALDRSLTEALEGKALAEAALKEKKKEDRKTK
jgi:hypothetical protein